MTSLDSVAVDRVLAEAETEALTPAKEPLPRLRGGRMMEGPTRPRREPQRPPMEIGPKLPDSVLKAEDHDAFLAELPKLGTKALV